MRINYERECKAVNPRLVVSKVRETAFYHVVASRSRVFSDYGDTKGQAWKSCFLRMMGKAVRAKMKEEYEVESVQKLLLAPPHRDGQPPEPLQNGGWNAITGTRKTIGPMIGGVLWISDNELKEANKEDIQ
jgi:hypothetical protein